ncbi:MAG: zinc ribbon domain-containing protein [Candidatus Omnitrophica bacterium]|nr:zinc ribbon domain-containing protein [Candidatus Omnitrophota bacterium]
MPFYEYRCLNCGKITTLYKKSAFEKEGFFLWWKTYRCNFCRSRKLEKVYSSFSVSKRESTMEVLNELQRMGPINFVPDYSPKGPPPGGCPYTQEGDRK